MSLICGILSRDNPELASQEALDGMLAVTRHRARDGQVTFLDPKDGVALGYCHTATFGQRVDTPHWYEDEAVVVAVDGDIYDAAMHTKGRMPSFKSVHAGAVVASYETDALAFPSALDGVFSLFLWDRRAKTLHLSADALRHKLVYYYEDFSGHLLVFSTELKAVLAHPSVPRQLDETVIPSYLTLGFCPAQSTPAKGVVKLRAAECLSFAPGDKKAKRYWHPQIETGPDDFDHWVSRARYEMEQAVNRTVGDAQRVSIYLSGGLESSAVLAALKATGGPEATAFTLAFKGHAGEYDVGWAARVAKVTQTPHQTVRVDSEVEVTPDLVSTLFHQIDEPFESATRVFNQYFLGKATREAGFDSSISGAMGGSVAFSLRHARQLSDQTTSASSLEDMVYAGFTRYRLFDDERIRDSLTQTVDPRRLRQLVLDNRELLDGLSPILGISLESILQASAKRQTLFSQYIPPLMGLDERTPFLDTRLAAFVLNVPPKFKGSESAGLEKALPYAWLHDALQIDFRQREKRAFPSAPLPFWLSQMLVPSLRPLVDDGVVREEYWHKLNREFQQGKKKAKLRAWQWFVFSCWYQIQIKQADPFANIG